MILQLPWPPSLNTYWRHVGHKTLLSAAGRQYRTDVIAAVFDQYPLHKPLESRLSVQITALPPDRRSRDLDNLLKGPLDAMEHAGVYVNDSQIDDLHIIRGPRLPGGHLVVFVERIEGGTP